MSIAPTVLLLQQPLPAEIQLLIDKPGEPLEDEDRRAPARRALLRHLLRAGVQQVEFGYRCDPIVVEGQADAHISLKLRSLRMQNGQMIPSDLVAGSAVSKALEGIGFVDVAFASRFGRAVDSHIHGLYKDEPECDDGSFTPPRSGLARVVTAKGDVMHAFVDEDEAQAIFDSLPDPEAAGLLSSDAAMRRRTTTSHRWR